MGKPPPLPPRPRDDSDEDDLIPLAAPARRPNRPIESAVPMANLAPPPMAMTHDPWLGSATPRPQRPGLVTAIGVLSIVLGSLAALGELISIFPIAQIYFLKPTLVRPSAVRVSPPAVAPVNLAPYAGDLKAADGLGRAEALAAVAGVDAVLGDSKHLSPDRKVMLARLLAECGRKAFAAPAPLDESAVWGEITEAGQFGAGPDGLYDRGTHFIRTNSGVILIDDSVARFVRPGLGRGGELRVDDETVTEGQIGRRRRSAAAVADELDDLRVRLGPSFNAMQAAALAQARFAQAPPPPQRDPQNRASRASDDRVIPGADARMVGTTLTYNSALWILADGRVIRDTIGRDPRTGSFTTVFVNPTTGSGFRRSTGWMLLAGTIAEMLLAVFLVFCGIAVFRDSPRAAGWHLQYVWLKFAMILIGLTLAQRFISELPQVVQRSTTANATDLATMLDANTMRVSTAIGTALALIYPIALLFAVPGSTVRSWYLGLGGGMELISPQFKRRAWPSVAWVRTPIGRIILSITGAMAALAAVGHLMLWMRGDGGMVEHCIWMALCIAAATTCMIGVLVTPRRGAVAAAVMVIMLVGTRPIVAQTTRPAIRKLVPATLSEGLLSPQARLKFFLAQLPVDPVERQAAVGQLLKTAQGLRYWSPIAEATGAGRLNSAEPAVAEAWNMLLTLRAARDPVIYELLNDPDVNVRREVTWLLYYTSGKDLSEASRAALARAVPRLVEMVREKPSRLQPAALDRLRDAGDDGWRAIYQLLLDPPVSPITQSQVVMRAAADPRPEFPAEDRKLAEQAVPKLLAMLTGPDLEGASTVPSARQVLLRLNGSPALAEGLKQLQAGNPSAYQVATTRLTDTWLTERKARLDAQAAAAAQAFREQQAREREAQIAARAAANKLGAIRSMNEQEQQWVSDLARTNRPADASEINRILKIPGLAELPPNSPMRVAVANALCRCGPDQLERWVDDAVSTDPAVVTRARWLLTLASTAPLPQALTTQRLPEDRERGFSVSAAKSRWQSQDLIAVGGFERRLIFDKDPELRRRAASGMLTGEIPLRLGPVSRKVARMAMDGAEWEALTAESKKPLPPPRKLEWRMPEQVAAAGSVGGIGLEGIIRTLSILAVALTGLVAISYLLLRPRIVSR